MSIISKSIKNQYPELYGYEHPWDIPGNTKESITTYFVLFEDFDGETRYCPVSKEFYEMDRNEKSKEFKREDRKTRCTIKSPDGKTEHVCRCKCSECPYGKEHRDIVEVSLDQLYDEYEYEAADTTSQSPSEFAIEQERLEKLHELLSLMHEADRRIVELFGEGLNDTEIAKELNKSRTTIVSRRKKLFEDLKEQLKDF